MLDERTEVFARTHEACSRTVHEDFCGKHRGVVTIRHAHSIRTRREDREQIAAFDVCRQRAIERKKVA